MSFDQIAILVLLVGMLAAFAVDRLRIEVVAIAGLALGIVLGLVPMGDAFSGFSNPAFITVVEILLIVQVLGRSGLLDGIATRLPAARLGEARLLALLCLVAATLSVFMNNIGALALMVPVVTSVCRVGGLDLRRMLMPVSYATLLGGLCSVIGTPANLLVSQQLAERTGRSFAFFDFAWVGIPVTIAALLAALVWVRRSLGSASAASREPARHTERRVVTEVVVPPASAFVGMPVADFPARIHAMRRDGRQVFFQRKGTRLAVRDVLLVEADMRRVEDWLADGTLLRAQQGGGERVEAVLMPESTLLGSRVGSLESFAARGVRVVAVASRATRVEGSLDDLQLGIGDILHLEGEREAIDEAVRDAELLPLWPRPAAPGQVGKAWAPVAVFGGGLLLAIFGLAQPPLAFGLVVLVLAATGALNIRQGLAALDWPILIMLAAMIPLGLAVETTGAGAVLASCLLSVVPADDSVTLVAAVLLLAVLITPFVNNASTAIVLGPIAIGIAGRAGLPPEPFLVAVALGASIDFLTPIGHHNNTIVMGLAGYRFSDFLKAGWPVTLTAVLAGLMAIRLFWLET